MGSPICGMEKYVAHPLHGIYGCLRLPGSIGLALALFLGTSLIGPCAARAQSNDSTQALVGPVNLPQDTLAADSYASYQEGQTLLATPATDRQAVAQISSGLEKLGAAGHLVVLDAGTKVEATGSGSQVRILAGPHSGQIWYLLSDEDVRKPDHLPPGARLE